MEYYLYTHPTDKEYVLDVVFVRNNSIVEVYENVTNTQITRCLDFLEAQKMTTRYQELKVWQKSIDLMEQIYVLVNKFPKTEIFALVDQIKRSAVSIASNIAE